MNHVTLGMWQAFILNSLSPEEREACEAHLEEDCAPCFELYLQALDGAAGMLPAPEQPAFQNDIMRQWDAEHERLADKQRSLPEGVEQTKRPRPWLQHPLFHYGVAASVTLLLMGSGVFQAIVGAADGAQTVRPPAQITGEPGSYSGQLMEKTIGLIHALESKREREEP
ncbi:MULTISPECIES: zf-HC2 domain-containing protein [Paenibacillus]|uniref:zf-HC2 domain-containing protein n=1 Tax=Paenibacillus TaxID=44249 RepID=UPI0022B8A509|nr:zf-HC2 domain-containing protein [Paenibacillus caseinilyticus]MCZ8523383.1 zf-HC2 domain-containing protein [Paenibacillus caseinilyticus]